jgi:Protein of unknown function (DUF1416)
MTEVQQAGASGHSTPQDGVRVLPGTGRQVVVRGRVMIAGSPLPLGYVRLLDSDGEFVAEVALAADGAFTFYTVEGDWTLRLLAPGGLRADRTVPAQAGMITEVDLAL